MINESNWEKKGEGEGEEGEGEEGEGAWFHLGTSKRRDRWNPLSK